MIAGKGEALNRRCHEVFACERGEEFYSAKDLGDGRLDILMGELTEDGGWSGCFHYLPDMSGRPHAKAYLLGERDDFDD